MAEDRTNVPTFPSATNEEAISRYESAITALSETVRTQQQEIAELKTLLMQSINAQRATDPKQLSGNSKPSVGEPLPNSGRKARSENNSTHRRYKGITKRSLSESSSSSSFSSSGSDDDGDEDRTVYTNLTNETSHSISGGLSGAAPSPSRDLSSPQRWMCLANDKESAHWHTLVEGMVEQALRKYMKRVDNKIADAIANRLRRITRENVINSVEREFKRVRRRVAVDELHPLYESVVKPLQQEHLGAPSPNREHSEVVGPTQWMYGGYDYPIDKSQQSFGIGAFASPIHNNPDISKSRQDAGGVPTRYADPSSLYWGSPEGHVPPHVVMPEVNASSSSHRNGASRGQIRSEGSRVHQNINHIADPSLAMPHAPQKHLPPNSTNDSIVQSSQKVVNDIQRLKAMLSRIDTSSTSPPTPSVNNASNKIDPKNIVSQDGNALQSTNAFSSAPSAPPSAVGYQSVLTSSAAAPAGPNPIHPIPIRGASSSRNERPFTRTPNSYISANNSSLFEKDSAARALADRLVARAHRLKQGNQKESSHRQMDSSDLKNDPKSHYQPPPTQVFVRNKKDASSIPHHLHYPQSPYDWAPADTTDPASRPKSAKHRHRSPSNFEQAGRDKSGHRHHSLHRDAYHVGSIDPRGVEVVSTIHKHSPKTHSSTRKRNHNGMGWSHLSDEED